MEREEAKFTREIRRTLKRAKGKVSVSESAELLGLHRTTLHRVYLDG